MATYAIGDVQGCFDELQRLLDAVRFDPSADRLWFTGDLVNRGPKSLEVLRFVRGLGQRAVSVLGNHDLHLAAAARSGRVRPRDTFQDVLAAPDREELIAWLLAQPLLHAADGFLLVHAGLAPDWDESQALACAAEVQAMLRSPQADAFLGGEMYGDQPDRWSARLRGVERLRFCINCFTRMRFITPEGRLDLKPKGAPHDAAGLRPWFAAPSQRRSTVLFGHWSALGRVAWPEWRAWGLDTGCVWGRQLTALRLEDRQLFSVPAAQAYGSD
ncbi:MAG TPA: symmetrical bis(5'-nucleosyl)-tetraphosphatase [Candidatus Binatia bacterium]|nr:symmetrical bis(5'-nucleosyl)-tetraphosphatase [Candidatus Binatia bacterium]